MAKFIVTAPDGKEYEITAPEGATQEQVMEYAKAQFARQAQEPTPSTQPTAEQPSTVSQIGRQLGLTARAGVKSLASGFGLGTMITDPIQSALGLKPASQGIDELLDKAGFPKPQNELERNVQTGVEVMSSIGGQARAAQELTKPLVGAFQKPGAVRSIAMSFSDDIGQQMAAGVPAAMTADYIANVAAESGADPIETGMYALSTGLLVGLAGGRVQRGLTGTKQPIFTPEMAKNQAREAYGRVKAAGVTIKSDPIKNTIDDIQRNLAQAEGGFYPNAIPEHKKVADLLGELRVAAEAGPMSFEALDKMRSNMVTMARESTDPSTRRLMSQAVEGLDVKMSTLQPSDLQGGGQARLGEALSAVREAREAWRRGAKATILEEALDSALRRGEAPTGREGEIIRKNFENLYANKKKMKLFTKEEQDAIKAVVQGGKGLEQVLNFTARFNPQRSTLMQAGTLGATFMNPAAGVAVGTTGFLSDKALQALQRNAARNVMSQIAAGKVPQPRSNAAWRALVEAEAQALRAQAEQQYQESQVAP